MVKIDLRDSKIERYDANAMIVIKGVIYKNIRFADEEKGELWYYPDLDKYPFSIKVVKGKFE